MKAIPVYPEKLVTISTPYRAKELRKKLPWNVLLALSNPNPQMLYTMPFITCLH